MTVYDLAAQIIRNILGDLPPPTGAVSAQYGWNMPVHYDYAAVTVGAFLEVFMAIDPNFDKQAFLVQCGLVEGI